MILSIRLTRLLLLLIRPQIRLTKPLIRLIRPPVRLIRPLIILIRPPIRMNKSSEKSVTFQCSRVHN